MKYEAPKRADWVYELAQGWLKKGQCTDLIVTCYQDEVKNDISCHKILTLPFLTQLCPPECLEELDHVILPHVNQEQLQQYLDVAYGLSQEDGEWDGDSVFKLFAAEVKVKVEYEEDPNEEEAEDAKTQDTSEQGSEVDVSMIHRRMHSLLRTWKVSSRELHNATLAAGLQVPEQPSALK